MKKIIVLVVVSLFCTGIMFAQEAASGPKTDNKIFGVQTGFVAGQNLTTEDTVSGRDFALFFTLSDSMQIGFRSITDLLADDASLFNLSYFFTEKISLDLMVGSTVTGGNTAAGLDVSFAIVKSVSPDTFSTTLKLEAGYLFDETDVAGGAVFGGLVGTIGY